MKILIAHNRYQQSGGEDVVVQAEYALLRKFAEDVRLYEKTNAEINTYSLWRKIKFLFGFGQSRSSYREFRKILRDFCPDVVHFHNIFFILSPSVYFACCDEGIPIVQSLHNFRLLCANGLFFRNHHVCEECVEKTSLWRGVWHRCYKKSWLISALIVSMLDRHWHQGTWADKIDCYITATEFSRQKYIHSGIPQEKIVVKPNFALCDAEGGIPQDNKKYALYAGRLSSEKGVDVLLKAWQSLRDIPLKIMGEGPLLQELKGYARAQNLAQVEFLGRVPQNQYTQCFQGAMFIVVPSVCYENFPRVIAEAYTHSIPVVASRLGTMEELVKDGVTGLLFTPGNPQDLAEKAQWIFAHENKRQMMRQMIHREYEEKYTAEENYKFLMQIYKKTIESHQKKQ